MTSKEEIYNKLLHAMQTGVKLELEYERDRHAFHTDFENLSGFGQKHLRVGINSSLITSSAIQLALERKGLITREEFYDAMIELLEKEVTQYENKIQEMFKNPNIKLA